MALPTQPLFVPIVGLDTKVDPKQGPVGRCVLLENVYFQRAGELRMRNGSTAFPALGPSSARALAVRGPTLYAHGSSSTLSSWSESASRWTGNIGLSALRLDVDVTPVYASQDAQTNPDCAVSGNLSVFAWETPSSGALAAVRDEVTGSFVSARLQTGLGTSRPRCAATASHLVVFYCNASTTSIRALALSASTGAVVNDYLVASDSAASPLYDVQLMANGRLIVAYRNSSGDIMVKTFDGATGVVSSAAAGIAVDCTNAVAWSHWSASDGNHYLLFAGSTSGVGRITVNAGTLGASGSTVIDSARTTARNLVGWYTGSSHNALYEVPGASASRSIVYRNNSVWRRHVGLATKVFVADGAYVVGLVYEDAVTPWSSVFVTDTSSGFPYATMLSGLSGGLSSRGGFVSSVASASSTRFLAAFERATRVERELGSFFTTTGIAVAAITAGRSPLTGACEAADVLVMPGGAMRQIGPGDEITDVGFYVPPPAPTGISTAAAGSLTAGQTFKFVVVPVYTDATGRVHRGLPSLPSSTITVGSGHTSIDLTIETVPLAYTAHIEVYRTVDGASGTYYRDGVVENIPSSSTLGYTSTVTDTELSDNEPLYTTGGVVENWPPPPSTWVFTACRRVWAVNGDELWPSKEIKQGVGVSFSDLFVIKQSDQFGAWTCGIEMDGRVVAFKANAVYEIAGGGPDDTNQGSFSLPRLITNAVGTSVPASVVLTPLGVFFQSAQGIYLITRGLEIQYVGAPVESWNSLAVTGAVHVPDKSQVRFSTASGRTLVYDYALQQWSTFTGQAAVSSVAWNGLWCYIRSDGTVLRESSSVYTEAGVAIPMTVQLAPLSLAGIGGFWRCREILVVGEYVGSHTLSLAMKRDGESAAFQTVSRLVNAVAPYLLRAKPKFQKATALELTLSHAGSSAGGCRITGLTLGIAVKQGLQRSQSPRPLT